MSIDGIGNYPGVGLNYSVPPIPKVDLEAVRRQDAMTASAVTVESPAVPDAQEEASDFLRTPNAKLEDISISFNKQDDFGYIGQDSDIRALDMERAISDMKKDQVLWQYQYFVGSARNLINGSEDGVVIPKPALENL